MLDNRFNITYFGVTYTCARHKVINWMLRGYKYTADTELFNMFLLPQVHIVMQSSSCFHYSLS